MALSQTSLDIEDLTVATLFNRGSVLSTFQQYVPIVSSYGTFNVWTNEPITEAFNSLFYGYSSGTIFTDLISSVNNINNKISSSIHYNTDTLSTFLNAQYSNIEVLKNIDTSTIYSYSNSFNENSTLVMNNYIDISKSFSEIVPGISTTVVTFYDTLFSPIASTLLSIGYYYYVPPPNIQSTTGIASRYIGPGLSTLYNISIDPTMPFSNDITTNFLSTLINTESGLPASNVIIDTYRISLNTEVYNTSNYIDTGSSISTFANESISTFMSTINNASTYGDYVSVISTYVTLFIKDVSVPTIDGYSISSIVNTASSEILFDISTLSGELNSSMVSSILLTPMQVFSTVQISTLVSSYNKLVNTNSLPGLFLIQSTLQATLIPFYAPLDVSTNYFGYQSLLSIETTMFSTLSTNFPYILGSSILSGLSTISIKISTLSTNINKDASTIYGTIQKNITAPGISSLYNDLSTNTQVSFIDYSSRISSILLTFSNAIHNVDSSPGLSSLLLSVEIYDANIQYLINNIDINILQYSNNYYTNIDSFSNISSYALQYTAEYTSAGILAFSTLSTVFANVSSIGLFDIKYISLMTTSPNGQFYNRLNYLNNYQSILFNTINAYQGSTIYYKMLPLIANYSTSIFVPGTNNTLQYLLRSTLFYDIYTSSISHTASSFIISGPLNINTSKESFNLNMVGSASIIPKHNQSVLPSIKLNNLDIYTRDSAIIPGESHIISARYSTITFNEGELTINRIYDSLSYGRIGINTLTPAYSLDIAIGNARKLSGTNWITPSDYRIKQDINEVDNINICEKISSIRLVSYIWSEDYCKLCNLTNDTTIGFLSQEVEKIFPKSVSEQPEFGYSNFKSLDIDQLYKAKFKLTQDLLQRFSTLESRLMNLSKES